MVSMIRDKSGVTKIGGSTVQVPTNISALAILSTNPSQDGDVFDDDGWVYQHGIPARKWFKRLIDSDVRYWPPKLDNLTCCEEKRRKALAYATSSIEAYGPIFEKVQKEAPFISFLDNGTKANGMVCFTSTQDGLSWNWVEHSNPKHSEYPLKQDVGDIYFWWHNRTKTVWGRAHLFNTLFRMAIDHHFIDHFFSEEMCKSASVYQKTLCVKINGNDYWIKANDARSRFALDVFSYPENTEYKEILDT